MPTDRVSTVLSAMARPDRDGPLSLVDRVCIAAVDLLSLSGAGLSLMVDGELRGTAGISEDGIATIQELQLGLGEGPCVDAWAGRKPVLEPDLADPAVLRWPVFAKAGIDAGLRAVFAFPMRVGAIRLGVLALYRDRPGELDPDEYALGLVLADVATHVTLGLQAGAPADGLHELLAREPAHWAEIHQATGMTAAQLGITLDDAFVRLRARSFAGDVPLRVLAADVVARRLRLDESTPRDPQADL